MPQIYKYIDSIPKPLLNDFIHNNVIPFVGAGFSKNADIPEGLAMPEWNELGKKVASEIPDYRYENNALDTLSYYETLFSRPKLIELLMRELHIGKIQPGSTYAAFCEVFTNIVCTTNFDFLLEDSFRSLQRPISVIATEDRFSIASEGETRLIKLHGDFNHPDRMVVTEHDYDLFIEKNPILATYISNLFITKTLLLVGYSLDDYDFRNLWQIINNRLGKMTRPAYCITVAASPEKIARYQRRNIKIINLKGEVCNYKTILREFFVELKEYIVNEKAKSAISTDEKIAEQLLLPPDSNRLCFISCTMSRIAQLKTIIYPVLENVGITPIRIDDMLMPGDNWMDIARMAISKSNMAIVDVSDNSPNVMYEFGLIQAEKEPNAIIVIAEKGSPIPFSFMENRILTYILDWGNHSESENSFQKELQTLCYGIISDHKKLHEPFEDANRLFRKGEFSPCIISAFSELEILFQERHNIKSSRISFPVMIKEQVDVGACSHSAYREVQKQWALRNKIIHGGYKASREDARNALDFALSFNQTDIKTVEQNLC